MGFENAGMEGGRGEGGEPFAADRSNLQRQMSDWHGWSPISKCDCFVQCLGGQVGKASSFVVVVKGCGL